MMKNRIAAAFAFVGLLGLAACDTDRDADVVVEQPVVEEPAPIITEPAYDPTLTDTTVMQQDTLGLQGDTAIRR